MLVSCSQVLAGDPILNCIAGGRKSIELQKGIYEVHHFGSSDFPRGYESYPEFGGEPEDEDKPDYRGPYGVCDSIQNLLEVYPELQTSDREFTVLMTPIVKAEQPASGGWRWHKWGSYIGIQNHTCEYIYDEPDVFLVYVYHIYERK
jgi:hypothetical protein